MRGSSYTAEFYKAEVERLTLALTQSVSSEGRVQLQRELASAREHLAGDGRQMKTYRVVFPMVAKEVEANSPAEAEQLAWDDLLTNPPDSFIKETSDESEAYDPTDNGNQGS